MSYLDFVIEGTIPAASPSASITYIAASPADMRASYTGSGLPFTSPEMALQGTPNKGYINLDSNKRFKLAIKLPNSYYAAHGTVLVPPTLYISYEDERIKNENTIAIKVDDSVAYRTLTYPNARTSASFYDVALPVRSQEQILRDSAYPSLASKQSPNFWGLKPAC